MDDLQTFLKDYGQKSNQLLQNAQTGPPSGRVPPPMPVPTAPVPPLITSTTLTNAANHMMPRNIRRVTMPMQYMPPTTNAEFGRLGGAYNSYPYRPFMNMNMSGGYSPFSSYGQPLQNQFQNPVIIAAAENSRPAFESIQSVVQSFNAVSMMLDSTLTAMQMSFQALLGVAENFTQLRSFMMKLYSTIVSFKLARWFLTKLFYLLRLVRGDRGSTAEEELWTALSATTPGESISSDNRSWPVIVFTGFLLTTPYFMYKLLNSITSVPNPLSTLNENTVTSSSRPASTPGAATSSAVDLNICFVALSDWSCSDSKTIPLVKGQTYFSSNSRVSLCSQNGGWLLVSDSYGRQGYVPNQLVKKFKIIRQPSQTVVTDASANIPSKDPSMNPLMVPQIDPFMVPQIDPSMVSEQTQPPLITMPIPDMNANPIPVPHLLNDSNKLEKDV